MNTRSHILASSASAACTYVDMAVVLCVVNVVSVVLMRDVGAVAL